MDIVTFETAKRLKEAGFPQPAPEFGQAWYDMVTQTLFLIVETFDDNPPPYNGVWIIEKGGNVSHIERELLGMMAYAPTATDILCRIPDNDFYFTDKCFYFSGDMEQGGENPAEVAAKKWLQ